MNCEKCKDQGSYDVEKPINNGKNVLKIRVMCNCKAADELRAKNQMPVEK